MEEQLLAVAAKQGIWTLLTVSLIYYILKSQEKRDIRQEERENNYQKIISTLTNKFNLVEEIKEDVSIIKNHIFKTE